MLKSSITQLLIALQLLLICTNAQLTFPSNYIKIPAPDMTFYFEFDDDTQTVNMGLDISQAVDYFAVGFANEGNYGMVTFDIVTVVFPFDNTTNSYQATISDMYSNKSGRPSTDTDIGGTSDYILDNFYYDATNGRSQALFHRSYNTKDQFDYLIDPQKVKTSIIMNWAIGTAGSHSFHTHNHGGGAAGTIISQMYNGFQGVAKDYFPGGLSPDVVLAVHGWVLLFAWGILVEVVVQIGRYRKFSRFFVSIHLALGTLLYSVTAVATGFALYIRWGDVSGTTRLAHFYLGFIIVGLSTLQVVGGLVLGIKMAAAKVTKLLPIINKGHLILGILIYLITKAQIGIGLYLFRPDLMVYLYIYYGLIIAFRIGQEYVYRVWARLSGKNTKKYITGSDSQTEKHQKLLEMLNSNIPLNEIFEAPEVKDLKWAVLDDKVFELKDFTHPGGNFILNQINGREIGRFIYGSYGLESLTQNTQHVHSSHALLVVQRNLIGTIQNGQNLITPINGNDSVDYKGPGSDVSNNLNPSLSIKRVSEEPRERLLPAPKTEAGVWILQNKVQLTPLISKFVFTCLDYFINPLIKDIRNIGRHMKVSHTSHKKIRLYTLVLSQTEVRTRRRENLWNKFLSKEKSSLVNLSEDSRFESLPLIIKKYNAPASSSEGNTSTFSGFLHNCAANSTGFSIEGPFGPGLGLTLDSTGVHCIIAAGTGFFPFLDLVDFLLESLLDPNSSNKLFKNGFKLHLFLSFNEMSDFVGLDMCEKLIQACRERGLEGAVRMTVRAKDAKNNDLYAVTREVFDNAFVEKSVNRNSVRVFVCGPPVFNQQIPSALSLIGIPKSGIVLV